MEETTFQDKKEELQVYMRYLNGFVCMCGGIVSLPLEDLEQWERLNDSWRVFLEENGKAVNTMVRKIGELQVYNGGKDGEHR